MRCDLADFERSVVEPILPMDREGPEPKNNRQALDGMLCILRAGSPWREPSTQHRQTLYHRFNRRRTPAHDGKMQMMDSSIGRVHQHASVRIWLRSIESTV